MGREGIIIGGGASGLMAAISAAEAGASVTVLEHMPQPGKKLLSTGNGKCNLTNRFLDESCYRSQNPSFPMEVIGKFPVSRTLSFFRELGILTDGSPIALTLPYLLVEDFQSAEDYFMPPARATFLRLLRLFALIVAIYLPAFYVSAQIFKLQLLPVRLLLTIAGSIRDIPLSPSLEMLLVLLVLEVLNEASIRMPKYVGMALSVVGALVLGETAVSAGFVSTPAIIIVAFSGIGLYAVPNLIEETSIVRLAMLLAAGSVGTYGILLLTAFGLVYLVSTENFGVPLAAPFSPLVRRDLRDALVKSNLHSLKTRPASLNGPNKRRMK